MRRLVTSTFTAFFALTLAVVGLMLAGCGSGGGLSSHILSGNASVGAPLSGEVSLKDSSSPPLQKTTVIGSDGSFAFDVTGLKAPYILQGSGSSAGKTYKLHSFGEGAGIANVNPLSNVVVAGASGASNLEQVYASPDPATLQKIKEGLPATTSDLLNQLQPLLKLYSATGKDPIKDHYDADHHGLDGLLDDVAITMLNGGVTITNSKTGAVIFTASVSDIKNGKFSPDANSLPQLPALPVVPDGVSVVTANAPAVETVPAAPAGVITAGGTKQVTLSWNSASTATSYNVYYATTPGVTKANGTKITDANTPAVHTGLVDATTYYYIVTAVNSAGESAASTQTSGATSL